MSGHTPGPWRTDDRYRGAILAEVSSGPPPQVAMATGRGVEELDANASLIAAAPELLAALHALVDQYIAVVEAPSGAQGAWDGNDDEEIIAARNAIAKATGGVDAAA